MNTRRTWRGRGGSPQESGDQGVPDNMRMHLTGPRVTLLAAARRPNASPQVMRGR